MWWWALVALELVAPHPNLSSKAGLWLRSWLSVIPSDTRNWLREVAQGTGELSYGSLLHLPSISPLQLNFSHIYIYYFSLVRCFFFSYLIDLSYLFSYIYSLALFTAPYLFILFLILWWQCVYAPFLPPLPLLFPLSLLSCLAYTVASIFLFLFLEIESRNSLE